MAGAKKTSSDSVADEVVVVLDDEMEVAAVDEVSEQPSKKKVKKEKKAKKSDGDEADVLKKVSSVKPMERQKKRKTLDKERHAVAVFNADVKVKPKEAEGKASVAKAAEVDSPSSGLPEFHISVFKDLALVDATVRESAVEALVTELQAVQEAYDKLVNKEMVGTGTLLEAEKEDGLTNCAPSVRYAIRRLIRGASSSREFARQGFALGLTLLLSKIPSIPIGPLLKLIVELLEVTSSMKGQEAKDSLLGRLFAYGALVRSERLIAEFVSDKSTPYIKEFTSLLITLAAKKRYLQEPAVALILDLVEKLPDEALLDHVLQTPGLHEWFEGAVEVGNPDALLLALKLRERISVDSSVFGKLLPNPYSHGKLFASDHISSLVNSLKESTFCQPRVHSVWPLLVNIILPESVSQDEAATSGSNSVKKHKKNRKFSSSEDLAKRFQYFYEIIIEGSLLQSSHDRKHLALDVLLLVLARLPLSLVPCVLSYKLVQCLMDILSTQDSWLYKVGLHFLKELSGWAKDDDGRRVSVILALQKHSKMKFDCITRTKTVKELMVEITTESGFMMFIQNLTSMFIDYGDASEKPSDHSQTTDDNSEIGSIEDKNSDDTLGTFDYLKIWVVESLPSILKHIKLDIEAKIRVQKEILKFLTVQGLFFASLGTEVTSFELQEKFKWPKAATSISLCKMCVEQLQLLLANALKAERPNPQNALDQSDLGSYFMRYLSTLCNIPSVSLFRSLSSEDENALKRLQAMESRLSTEERKCGLGINANKIHALRFLLIQLVLQVLLRPGEFAESSCELVLCCKKFIAAPDLMDISEDELDSDEAPELMDVLLDTLLSLLPQSSTPLRSAIEQVFKCFCENVTDDGVIRMLQIIRKEALKPRRSHKAESDDDSDNIEDDFLEIKEDDESDEDGESHGTDESDGQTDDSKAALGNEAVGQEHPEGSDDSDEGMDDETMFKMDKHLVNIFRERKKQTGVDSTHAQLVLFKLRVLPLLETYLHENPGKPQVLTVYTHLAQAFLDPQTVEGSPQLGQRILGILQKKILKVKDYPKGKGVELHTLESLLEKNLKLASRPFRKPKAASNPSDKKQSAALERHKMIVSLAQNSTFWIMSIITVNNFPIPELQKIFNIFEDVLSSYFDSKKSQLKSGFPKEIFRRRPWIGHHLFGFLLEKCGNAKSEFRKVEALDLVIDILKSMAPSTDTTSSAHLKKLLKNNLPKLCHLVKELATNLPQKQARQSQVRKFCTKVLQIVSAHNHNKSFLKELATDAPAVYESKLGECFLALKK